MSSSLSLLTYFYEHKTQHGLCYRSREENRLDL